MSPEALLATWARELRWKDVPVEVQERVENLLLDTIASSFAGRELALVARAEAAAEAFAGTSAASAVFVDAYRITSATICDVYRPGLCHVTPVVVPPLFALARKRGSSRDDLLAALTVGLELVPRLCRGLSYPELRRRGWHTPGVVGPIGAAAAAARLVGADPLQAMAHAAAQSAGTFVSLGTEAVKFNQARGAVAGLLATLAAEAGLEASSAWLTGSDGGLAASYGDGHVRQELTTGLGRDWELLRISLRRWPAASSVQSLIDAVLELAARRVEAGDVRALSISLAPAAYEVSGERLWTDTLGAMQSARWVAAATLHDRDWWLESSGPGRTGDPTVGRFASERVTVAADGALAGAALRLEVALASGDTLSLVRQTAPGDPDQPLSRDQIEAKLRRAAPGRAEDVLAELASDDPAKLLAVVSR